MSTQDDFRLPPPPERPDCCAGGCAICVLEEYVEQMQAWEAECERLRKAWQDAAPPPPAT